MSYHLPLGPRPSRSPVPLTAVQKVYWQGIAKADPPLSPFRNLATSLRLLGPLSRSHLQDSLQTVVSRHESLRARIRLADDSPVQIIDPPGHFQLQVVDLRRSQSAKMEEDARRLCKEFLEEKVDIASGSAFDARLLQLSRTDHVLIVVVDHIVSDAISWSILARELLTLFNDRLEVSHASIPDLRLQFSDYAYWEYKTNQEWRKDHEPYWREHLASWTKLVVPRDRHSTSTTASTSSVVYTPFGKQLTDALRELARRERCLMPLVILSLYLVAMSRWCERKDLLVNFLSHGRSGNSEFKNMIGCMAYSIVLRVEIVPTESLREVLARVTSELQGALAHDASRVFGSPIIAADCTELYFNWLPAGWDFSGSYPAEHSNGELSIRRFPIAREMIAEYLPFFMDTPSGIMSVIWYSGDQFLKSRIERFSAALKSLAETFVDSPDAVLGSLEFGA